LVVSALKGVVIGEARKSLEERRRDIWNGGEEVVVFGGKRLVAK
jgi:hypothetical protein